MEDKIEIPERFRDSLIRQWRNAAETLLNRDGNDPRFPNGGHKIKGNHLLISAIEEIRDCYYQLFYQKAVLTSLIKQRQNDDETIRTLQVGLADLDYDLIKQNKYAFERLKLANYGLDDAKVASIKSREPEVHDMPGLSEREAMQITGTIIKRSINSFEITFSKLGYERPNVPHVPLRADPENVGRKRSEVPWRNFVVRPPSDGQQAL